jgi:predicted nucleic acid-binding protein
VNPSAPATADRVDLSTATGRAGIALLRRQLDQGEAEAASLLEALPPPPSLEPGKGRRFDSYA